MGLVWKYIRRNKIMLVVNIICVFGFVLVELGLPTLLSRIINEGLIPQNPVIVKQLGLYMLLISFIGMVSVILLNYSVASINTGMIKDMRDDLYEKTLSFSHAEFEKFGVPALITAITNDAYQILLFMQNALRIILITPVMFISSFIMIFLKSPSLSLVILAALPFLALGIFIIIRKATPLSSAQQSGLDDINMNLRESLSGLRVIRAFVREKFQEKRFDDVNANYASISEKLFKLMAFAMPGFLFVFDVVVAVVLWFGVKQIDGGLLAVGDLTAFIEYIFHALFSFMIFSSIFVMYPRASVSIKRIQDLLNTTPSINHNHEGATETETAGYIKFENVTFAYPGDTEEAVIRDVSFEANPGEIVAFIGSTGSGKSTLVQLIPRFFDVTKGRILIDGVDVRDYQIKALRQKIGFIPQKALLFSGTIAENIRFGKHDASNEEIDHAADIAQAKHFIEKKPEKFNESLAEGGSNISGGQKQRLSIARALIKEPEIFIFDDSFSALDYKTDALLRARLREVTTHSTVLIVAQRVGTIRNADKIIVLDKGKVVAQGTHKELLHSCEIYYHIAASQLSEEELA